MVASQLVFMEKQQTYDIKCVLETPPFMGGQI